MSPLAASSCVQPGTETGYIQRAVAAYAATYPAVAFELIIDGRRAFVTAGSGDAIAAATAAWGTDVGRAAIPLEPLDESAAVPGVTVDGWITAPELSRSHRQGIVIFVNGRWVQNRALAFALEEAYHSLILVGRHPLAAIHIRLDPAAVDVNVHPTKAEVKFVDERAACRAVQRAVHTALARRSHDDLPQVRFEPIPTAPSARQRPIPFAPPRFGSIETRDSAPETESQAPNGSDSVHPSGVPMLRVLGQIAASFIIAEGPDGMYLIDQHAAHERVLYERILTQLRERAVDRQTLLDPLVVDLTSEEMAAFERSAAELAEIGFEIDRWDGGAVAVRAIPALVKGVDVAQRLRLILRELVEGGQGESWLDAVAVSTACHTSIRAGQPLSIPERTGQRARERLPAARLRPVARQCCTSPAVIWKSSFSGDRSPMPLLRAAAERTVPAPAAAVYALLADYRDGHPRILPPAFSDLMVLQGGIGAGTIIRFALKFAGRRQVIEARVEEPEPGRVLSEAYPDKSAVTRFIVDPVGDQSHVRIETSWEPSRGLAGQIERLIAPRLFRKLYMEELDLIERWAVDRVSVECLGSSVIPSPWRGISSLFYRRPDGTRYFSPRLDTHATVKRTTSTRDRCGSPKIPPLVHECQDGDVTRGRKPTLEGDRYRASSRRRSLFGSKRCARSGSNPNQRRSPISAG